MWTVRRTPWGLLRSVQQPLLEAPAKGAGKPAGEPAVKGATRQLQGARHDLLIFDDIVQSSKIPKFSDLITPLKFMPASVPALDMERLVILKALATGNIVLTHDSDKAIFYITEEQLMSEAAVNVSGSDIREVQRKAGYSISQSYLTIEPIDGRNWNNDEKLPVGSRAIPATQFQVTWNGPGERFSRTVTGEKELFDVLKPIVRANLSAMKLLEKQRAESAKNKREYEREELRSQLRGSNLRTQVLQKQLDELG